MENTPLHTQKVAILSRLVKESSLTLEEALLLLKEEEVVESVQKTIYPNPYISSPSIWPPINSPYFGDTVPLTGNITVSSSGTGVLNTSNTTANLTPSTPTADLNT